MVLTGPEQLKITVVNNLKKYHKCMCLDSKAMNYKLMRM